MNTSQPMPQTSYDKNTDCVDGFWQQVSKFVFNVNNLLFSQISALWQTQTSSGYFENLQFRFGSPRRDPFFDPSPPSLVLINTLGTTGLDQSTNRCVMLWRQVGLFLDLLQSHGNNRFRLRFHNYTTVFIIRVDWLRKAYAGFLKGTSPV